MNQVTFSDQVKSQVLTMSSRDIAELTDKRHDNVKRAIGSLAEAKIITLPQIEETSFLNSIGRTQHTQSYIFHGEQGKRDSIIVVAQLCPQFTAHLVDRWYELEQQAKKHYIDLNDPYALRHALFNYTGQVIELEAKNAGLENAIQIITHTNNAVKFQQACKILNIKHNVLAQWLRSHGWDRHLNSARTSTYYSETRGYCETKYQQQTKVKNNGDLGTYSQIDFFILPKGMQVLAKHFNGDKR